MSSSSPTSVETRPAAATCGNATTRTGAGSIAIRRNTSNVEKPAVPASTAVVTPPARLIAGRCRAASPRTSARAGRPARGPPAVRRRPRRHRSVPPPSCPPRRSPRSGRRPGRGPGPRRVRSPGPGSVRHAGSSAPPPASVSVPAAVPSGRSLDGAIVVVRRMVDAGLRPGLGVRTLIDARQRDAGRRHADGPGRARRHGRSGAFVRIADLETAASARIAAATGAEAGYVTCGAAAGLRWVPPPSSPGWTPTGSIGSRRPMAVPTGCSSSGSTATATTISCARPAHGFVEVGGPAGATASELEGAIVGGIAGVFFQADEEPSGLHRWPTRSRRAPTQPAGAGRRLGEPPRTRSAGSSLPAPTSSRSAVARPSAARRHRGSLPAARTSSGRSRSSTRTSTCCPPRGPAAACWRAAP